MMKKQIPLQKLEILLTKIKREKKTIVLTGGCFDILHVGHIKFLQEAKKWGDYLLVLLESDAKVKLLKGRNRPFFPQRERASVLAALKMVDYIVMLPALKSDRDYQQLILKISPFVIAITANDPLLEKKTAQAKNAGGKLKVIPQIKTFSSSEIAKLIGLD